MRSKDASLKMNRDPALSADLNAIDRRTIIRVALVPLLLAPVGMVLMYLGLLPLPPEHIAHQTVSGALIIAQAISVALLAWLGHPRAAIGVALLFGCAILIHSSLIAGFGLHTTTVSGLATLCFLVAYVYGSRIANRLAFASLTFTILVAMVLMASPAWLADRPTLILQPTGTLLAHLGLFIHTYIICDAFQLKKRILLSQLEKRSQELETALTQRRLALRKRQALLGQIAHNLRTPLATVRSALQLMERTTGQTERQERYAHNLLTAADKMAWQTGQFALYKSLQDNTLKPQTCDLHLAELLENCLQQVRKSVLGRAARLHLQLSTSIRDHVHVDGTLLSRMLRNLLDNALKYAPAADITVMVDEILLSDGSSLLTFAVSDPGSGIHPDIKDQLFEPFVQGSENPDNAMEGSGLGLYIVRGLARRMGGEAGCDNLPAGGCRSWFTIRQTVPQQVKRQAA